MFWELFCVSCISKSNQEITFLNLVSATYIGWAGDVMTEKGKSVKIKSSTDVYITFFDISVVELVVVFGIYITPFRFKTFCSYVECICDVKLQVFFKV